jgi:hypothetical protein
MMNNREYRKSGQRNKSSKYGKRDKKWRDLVINQ